MKNISVKLKLAIFAAIAVVVLLLAVSVGQLISIHKKNKQASQQEDHINILAQTIASQNPPSSSANIKINNVTINFGGEYDN